MARTAIIVLILYILACGTTAMRPWTWPGGPYALPMSKYGCLDYDETLSTDWTGTLTEWAMGYINMTFTSSIRNNSQCRPTINTTIYDFNATLYQFDIYSDILGPFDDYNLQMNFCFKTNVNNDDNERSARWLDGNYSVFGAEDGCPSGFTSREVTLCLPPILQWNEDGHLPYYNLSTGINGTRMRLLLCDKTDTQLSHKLDELGQFMLVKTKDIECPLLTNETTYPFPVYDETLEEVRFCLHHEPAPDLFGTQIVYKMYLIPIEVSFGAGELDSWIVLYRDGSLLITGITIHSKWNSYPETIEIISGMRITVCNTVWSFYNNGGQECKHRCSITEIWMKCMCSSPLIGRYIAVYGKFSSSSVVRRIYDSTFQIYAVHNENVRVSVKDDNDLGMQDYHIKDYQLGASSSASTTPYMARPQLTGWCANDNDPNPFYQIDLIKETVVSGISIYNGEQSITEINNKNTYVSDVTLKGTRGFHIRYWSQGSENTSRKLYKEKEFRIDLSRPFAERQTFWFLNPFRARYVRVIPSKAYPTERVCLKLELQGTKLYDIHSLDCKEDSLKEMYRVSRAIIPSTSDIIYYDGFTLDTCTDACLSNHSECMAIEFSISRGQCKTYLSDANKPYTDIQLSSEFDILLTANCPPPYITDWDVYLNHKVVDSIESELFTSTGYPFEHIYQYRKITSLLPDSDVAVVLTDISLMYQQARVNDRFVYYACSGGININWAKHFDNSHNGLRLVVSSDTELSIEYDVCLVRKDYSEHEASRGYRGYAFVPDKRYCNSSFITEGIQGLCTRNTMFLHSLTFLGYPMIENTKYTWWIEPALSYVAIEWLFEDFDISCQLDAKVSITDVHGNKLINCNSNRYIGRQYFPPPFLEVTLQTSLNLQNVFIEGMKASYSLVLYNTVTSDNMINAEASCVADTASMYSKTFNKCYHVYHNDGSVSWTSAVKECSSTGMTLVTIKSVDEMMFIKDMLVRVWFRKSYKRFKNRRITVESHHVHIGLSRYLDETGAVHELWIDGTPVTFTAWAIDEPRNVHKRRCTRMDFFNYYGTNVWSSEPCHNTDISDGAHYFICEKLSLNEPNLEKDEMRYRKYNVNEKHITTGFESLFRCTNGEVTSVLHVCDGIVNCRDASDEENCGTADDSCGENQFKCGTGECIHISGLCDFIDDCTDASDEYCDHPPCDPQNEYHCENSECVPAYKSCDGKLDCLDGSDEKTCDSCNKTFSFHCDDVKCIPRRRICDNVHDCSDGSDETECNRYKTCDDVIRSGIRKTGVFKMYTDQYMECDFGNIDNGTVIMKYWNIDWHVMQKDKEYVTNSDQFFILALADHYSCFQNFTPILRPVDAMIVKFDKYDSNIYYDSAVFKIDPTSPDNGQVLTFVRYPVTNHSHFEISKTGQNQYGLRLYIHTPFDIDKFRIPMGPIECSKVVPNIPNNVFPCGYNMEPASSDEVCVYELDSDGKVKGCRNLEHLQNCSSAQCPDGYVKCPDSFCIPPEYVCNERVDCPNGQDEINCWCIDEPSTLIVAVYAASLVQQKYAFSMASRFVGTMRAVYVMHMYYDQTTDLVIDIHNLTKPSEHVPEVYSYLNIINMSQVFFGNTFNGKLGLVSVTIPEEYLEPELDLLTSLKNDSLVEVIDVYHLYFDSELRMPATIAVKRQDELLNLTEVRVQKYSVLSAMGSLRFRDICKDDTLFILQNNRSVCSDRYVCNGARVCISLKRVCDGQADCPFGDDERLCDFRCPANCYCKGFSVMCNKTDFSWNDLKNFSEKIRSLVVQTSSHLPNNPLELYKTFPYISTFNVSNSDISAVLKRSLRNIPNVKILDLRYNKIRTLEADTFVELRHLTELHLKGNRLLTNIEPGVFAGLRLSDLSLKGCGLLSLKEYTFKGLKSKLSLLDISYNQIAEISDYAFDGLNAEHIDMSNNPVETFGRDLFTGVTSVKRLETPAYKFCCILPKDVDEESCSPHQDEFSSCKDLMRNSALQALMWIIGIFALIGNLLSLGYRLIFDRKRFKIGYGIFVTNLAVADLLMGVYMLIIAVADTMFRNRYILMDEYWRSSWWCRISGVISTISSEASVLFISLITIDRILVVKYPFGQVRFSTKTASLAAGICWAITIILAIIPILHTTYFEDRFYTSRAVCVALPLTHDRPPGWLYSIVIFIGFNFITFVLIAIGQFLIYAEMRKSAKTRKMMNVSRKMDLAVARNLLLVVSTDFLCWFPIGCMGVLSMLNIPISSDVYSWTVVLILPINSALNPFLYTYSVLITQRNLNPSVDEQERSDVSTEVTKAIKKLLPRLSYGKRERPLCPIENTLAVRKLKPTEVCHIWMALVEYMALLHDNVMVTGNINEQIIMTEVDEKGEMQLGEVQFLDTPKMINKTAAIAMDIHKMGLFINRLLR